VWLFLRLTDGCVQTAFALRYEMGSFRLAEANKWFGPSRRSP
jgi:hypothetical protein